LKLVLIHRLLKEILGILKYMAFIMAYLNFMKGIKLEFGPIGVKNMFQNCRI
jgi:hypothetical protein